jgi:hypothetical protein
MRRSSSWLLVVVMLAFPAAAALASTAAYGTLRREAIKAVSACRNMSTVSRQIGDLAADVGKESTAVKEGTSGRIAVIRERLVVLDGKVGELERKQVELRDLAVSIQGSAKELKAAQEP